MVNSLGTAKEFYLLTDMCKTLQNSPFFILFPRAAIPFKIWRVFNLLISKIIHTHPSEKRGFPDRWEATPYPPSFSGPFCRGQTRLFLPFLPLLPLPFPSQVCLQSNLFLTANPISVYTPRVAWINTGCFRPCFSIRFLLQLILLKKNFWGSFFFNVDQY